MAINTTRPTAITATTAGTAQTVYTAGANGAVVRRLVINSVDAAADHTFTLCIVATAGTTANGTSDRLIGPITVPAEGFYNDTDIIGLEANEAIKIFADDGTTALNFYAAGLDL